MENNSPFETFELQLVQEAQNFLRTASGWGLFLSIVGFIGCAFGILGCLGILLAGSAAMGAMGDTAMPATTMGLIFLIGTIVMFFPVLYLYKFSSSMRQALINSNTQQITKAFGSLKGYFMWCGILTITWIVLYIVMMITVISTAAQMANM